MYALARALVDRDTDLLRAIANLWDINLPPKATPHEMVDLLAARLGNPEAVAETWSRLPDEAQAALAALQAGGGRLPLGQFTRAYGELRPMGPARRDREKPWLNPANTTESLYYRGLIDRAFAQSPAGAQEYIFVPHEILAGLPASSIEQPTGPPGESVSGIEDDDPDILHAYRTAPDDLTTLLAHFRLNVTQGIVLNPTTAVAPAVQPALTMPLQWVDDSYQNLLIHLAYELGLITNNDAGDIRLVADTARPWLEAPRPHQFRSLAEAWRDSATWNDLRDIDWLVADEWHNDPLAARRAILAALARVTPGVWWSLDSFVAAIKQETPDFQRPGGDYASWYIRNEDGSEVLHGFENWDLIDGALVRYVVNVIMVYLGMVDWHVTARAFRLTRLGQALVGSGDWPSYADPEAQMTLDEQLVIRVPPDFNRYDRYQIARFAKWRDRPQADDSRPVYVYEMTPASLHKAAGQDITVDHILRFLKRNVSRIPESVEQALTRWQAHGTQLVLQDVVLLVAEDVGIYESLKTFDTLKRWLGQPLGDNAYVVARHDVPALAAALRRLGLLPHFEGFEDEGDDW